MKPKKYRFLNTDITGTSFRETLEDMAMCLEQKVPATVAFVNVDVALRIEADSHLRTAVDLIDYVLLDGMPLVWVARWFGHKDAEKISGSDFIPALCDLARQKNKTVFLLGGAEGVGEKAKARLEEKFPGVRIVGTYSPPWGFEKKPEELEEIEYRIRSVQPDVLVVCFGCPKQEKFMASHAKSCGAWVTVCGGGTLDFLAGNVKRCPKWVSKIGMEWFYRFSQEPKRLFKRYFVEGPGIISLVWKYRPAVLKQSEQNIR